MSKKGQLGIIEFKFFMYGLFTGLIGSLVLTALGKRSVLPFSIPFVCGFNRKGQLVQIEFHYFMAGFAIGLIGGFILIALGQNGILPFPIPFVCD